MHSFSLGVPFKSKNKKKSRAKKVNLVGSRTRAIAVINRILNAVHHCLLSWYETMDHTGHAAAARRLELREFKVQDNPHYNERYDWIDDWLNANAPDQPVQAGDEYAVAMEKYRPASDD